MFGIKLPIHEIGAFDKSFFEIFLTHILIFGKASDKKTGTLIIYETTVFEKNLFFLLLFRNLLSYT